MKKVLAVLALSFTIIISCDKVEHPIVKKDPVVTPPVTTGPVYVTNSNQSISNYRKVLLEDYTGHRCPNCPTGNDIIRNILVPRYKDSLIVMSIHQGNTFAAPQGTLYVNDYRTEAGEAWGSSSGGFGVSFWPAGIVNRKKYGSTLQLPSAAWSANVPKGLKEPFILKLDVNTNYELSSRILTLTVKSTCMATYTDNIKIIVGIVQDSIVSPQDVRGVEDDEYEFEHMFRGAFNGTWGEILMSKPIQASDSLTKKFSNLQIPSAVMGVPVNDKKVSIVVIAYNESNKEVVQAEKVALRPK
jgi:hypothetical protein